MHRLIPATICCLIVATALAGCGGGGDPQSDTFSTVLSTDKTDYALGEQVVVSLTVTNLTQLTAQVPDAWANFGIYDHNGAIVFQTVHLPITPGPIETFTAGESRLFTLTWLQVDQLGAAVPAGIYEARARLRDDHTPDLEAKCTFAIALPASGG